MDIQEQLRAVMAKEALANGRRESRRPPLTSSGIFGAYDIDTESEIEQDRRRSKASRHPRHHPLNDRTRPTGGETRASNHHPTSEHLDIDLEDSGNPPGLDAALRTILHGYGMDFLNYKSKGHFEGYGPYFVDNIIEFDSARRYNPSGTINVRDGKLAFQVGDFINDLNTTSSLYNLAQMELTPFYIPLCGNEKIMRWGIVQLFICEFLSESASRNRQQKGSWHWELTAEVVGPRIRLSPNLQQRLFTFRIPLKRVDDVLTFEFRTPSGPLVFCNEFAPGDRVAFNGVDTFETFQGGATVNTGFNVGEIASLERRQMPAGPQSPTGQWIPDQIIPGTDLQGMEILALPSGSEIQVSPADVDTAVLAPSPPNSEWRLHNLSRQVLIPIKFRSIRAEPTQYLIATAR